MGVPLKKYPEEGLRIKLEEIGLPRTSHDLESLQAILGIGFKGVLDTIDHPDVAAGMLIYLHKAKILEIKDTEE